MSNQNNIFCFGRLAGLGGLNQDKGEKEEVRHDAVEQAVPHLRTSLICRPSSHEWLLFG